MCICVTGSMPQHICEGTGESAGVRPLLPPHGHRDWIQAINFSGKHPYWLSHIAGPDFWSTTFILKCSDIKWPVKVLKCLVSQPFGNLNPKLLWDPIFHFIFPQNSKCRENNWQLMVMRRWRRILIPGWQKFKLLLPCGIIMEVSQNTKNRSTTRLSSPNGLLSKRSLPKRYHTSSYNN